MPCLRHSGCPAPPDLGVSAGAQASVQVGPLPLVQVLQELARLRPQSCRRAGMLPGRRPSPGRPSGLALATGPEPSSRPARQGQPAWKTQVQQNAWQIQKWGDVKNATHQPCQWPRTIHALLRCTKPARETPNAPKRCGTYSSATRPRPQVRCDEEPRRHTKQREPEFQNPHSTRN